MDAALEGRSTSSPSRRRREIAGVPVPPRRLLVRRVLAFSAAGGLVAYLAFEGGGYDIVVRQQVALLVWALVAVGFATGLLPRGERLVEGSPEG